MTEPCLVCQEHALAVPVPGGHLVATDKVVAFHPPPWPPTSKDVFLGYLLVTSRRHVPGMADLSDEEAAEVGQCITRLSRALRSLGAERVYVLAIGDAVPHLHVHLFPRWPGTPSDVSWRHVDDWEGARRGDFGLAADLAHEVKLALGD